MYDCFLYKNTHTSANRHFQSEIPTSIVDINIGTISIDHNIVIYIVVGRCISTLLEKYEIKPFVFFILWSWHSLHG